MELGTLNFETINNMGGSKFFTLHSSLFTFHFSLFTLTALLLLSCGSESGRFRLEGRLRHMNQAEFLIYSPDGGIDGIDTIQVREGRFAYETELREPFTFVLVFPNYSEQPIFAEPGAKVTIKGDASQMKEMTILGTDDNELMTSFRMQLNELMPPDVPKAVVGFIKENPQSLVSIYLLKRYLVYAPQPDLKQAYNLASMLLKQKPDNGQLIQLKKQLTALQGGAVKSRLPKFSVNDIKGKTISENNLKAKVNVVSVWASWNYPSTDMQRRLRKQKEKYGDKLAIVSICIDGNPSECRRVVVDRDSLKWPTVCDGHMWETSLLQKLGIATVPANLLIDDKGIIVERNLTPQQLEEKIDQRLREN